MYFSFSLYQKVLSRDQHNAVDSLQEPNLKSRNVALPLSPQCELLLSSLNWCCQFSNFPGWIRIENLELNVDKNMLHTVYAVAKI